MSIRSIHSKTQKCSECIHSSWLTFSKQSIKGPIFKFDVLIILQDQERRWEDILRWLLWYCGYCGSRRLLHLKGNKTYTNISTKMKENEILNDDVTSKCYIIVTWAQKSLSKCTCPANKLSGGQPSVRKCHWWCSPRAW